MTGVYGYNIHVGTLLTLTILNHTFRLGILIRRSSSSTCKCVQIMSSLRLLKSAISCLSVMMRRGKGISRLTNDGKHGTVLLSEISVCFFMLLRFKFAHADQLKGRKGPERLRSKLVQSLQMSYKGSMDIPTRPQRLKKTIQIKRRQSYPQRLFYFRHRRCRT